MEVEGQHIDGAAQAGEHAQGRREFVRAITRAFGGAIIFGLPMLMTMEMWWLGFYISRFHLVLALLLMMPLLVGLARLSGFEPISRWIDAVVDAMVAYGVAFVAAAVVLTLFGVIEPGMPIGEIVGKVALQAIAGSFGAILANSQLHGGGEEDEPQTQRRNSYGAELLLMLAGALFLALNVAPTEEMLLIAYMMTEWHALALAVVSLALMHAFVYSAGFKGQEEWPEETPWWSLFLRFTVVGYAIALLISAYVLWTFGRYTDHSAAMYIMMAVVLGFPASIGAAAARLIL